jgi:formylglycine-generating enzyme required for sulfatase activity
MSTLHLAAFSLDPVGPAAGDNRELRGGAWNINAHYARAVACHGNYPDFRDDLIGFRLARTVP